MNISGILKKVAKEKQNAYKTALKIDKQSYTYSQLVMRIDSLSISLKKLGLGPGARIVFLYGNGVEYIDVLFASAQIGAVFSPIDNQNSVNAIMADLKALSPDVLFIGRSFLKSIAKFIRHVPSLKFVIPIEPYKDYMRYDRMISKIQIYSGDFGISPESSGIEIACNADHRFTYSFQELSVYMDLCVNSREPGVFMLCLPNNSIVFIKEICTAFATASRLIMLENFHPRSWIVTATGEKVTDTYITSSIIRTVLHDPNIREQDFSGMRMIRSGRTYLDKETIKKMKDVFPGDLRYEKTYGFPSPIAILSIKLSDTDIMNASASIPVMNAIGKPLEGTRIRAFNRLGEALPDEEIGELFCAGEPDDGEAVSWTPLNEIGWVSGSGYVFLGRQQSLNLSAAGSLIKEISLLNIGTEEISAAVSEVSSEVLFNILEDFQNSDFNQDIAAVADECIRIAAKYIDADAFAFRMSDIDIDVGLSNRTINSEIDGAYSPATAFPDRFFVKSADGFMKKSLKEICRHKNACFLCLPIYTLENDLGAELFLIFKGRDAAGAVTPQENAIIRFIIKQLSIALRIVIRQKQLEKTMKVYAGALQLSSDGITLTSLSLTHIIFSNRRGSELLSIIKKDEVFRETITKIQEENFNNIRIGGMQSSSRSGFYLDEHGEKRWVNFRAERMDVDGEKFVATFLNMRENRNTAQHLENLLGSREIEIIKLISQGYTNRDIAEKLCISVNTVKFYIKRIYERLEVSNRAELMASTYLREPTHAEIGS